MGGGGGDGGYQARQDQIDASKTAARSKLNALFGIAPSATSAAGVAAPSPQGGAVLVGSAGDAGEYIQAAAPESVGAAPAADTSLSDEAAKNKAALDALYGKVRTDAFDAGRRRIDEQKTAAGRNLKFELFAKGLNAGSVDVDQNALLGRTYTQGLTDLGAKADNTSNQLKAADQAARLQLLQSIDSGMDQGSAVSSALGQMQTNASKAAADATGANIGNLFADVGLLYQQSNAAKGKQAAQQWFGSQYPGYNARGSGGTLTGTGG